MGAWTSDLSAGPLPSAASEKTPHVSMPALSQPLSPFATPVATTSANQARTTLTLADNSRHNHVGVAARARTTLAPAHNSRRHHVSVTVCALALLLLFIITGDSFAPSVALFGFNNPAMCARSHRRRGTSTPVDTRWSTCILRHEQ